MEPIFTDVKVYHGEPAADYFARPEVSRSDLVKCLTDPARFMAWKTEHRATKAMDLGTLVHELVLTPETAHERICVLDYPDWRTKDAKADRDAARAEDLIPVLREPTGINEMSMAKADDIAAVCRRAFGGLLDGGDKEVVIVATHIRTGLRVKARLDLVGRRGSLGVTDLKTARDASREGMAKAVGQYRLDIQAAIYSDLTAAAMDLPVLPFCFACVETDGDYLTGLWDLSDAWIAYGREGYEQAIDRWIHYQSHPWPTSHGRGTLEPKPWDLK